MNDFEVWHVEKGLLGLWSVCRTFDDMYVTMRQKFTERDEAEAYAQKLNNGEIRLSNPNF